MNPVSEDIKDILIDSANDVGDFASTTGWSIHIGGEMPDSPDTCILINDVSSFRPPDPKLDIRYPTVQIQVRGSKGGYDDAYDKAEEVVTVLHGLTEQTYSGARYLQILCSSDIMYLNRDSKQRPTFSINFQLHRVAT